MIPDNQLRDNVSPIRPVSMIAIDPFVVHSLLGQDHGFVIDDPRPQREPVSITMPPVASVPTELPPVSHFNLGMGMFLLGMAWGWLLCFGFIWLGRNA